MVSSNNPQLRSKPAQIEEDAYGGSKYLSYRAAPHYGLPNSPNEYEQ